MSKFTTIDDVLFCDGCSIVRDYDKQQAYHLKLVLNSQADTIEALHAENKVLSLRERELVEACERKDNNYNNLKNVMKSFKQARDEALAEIERLKAVIQDSQSYEVMITDGSDESTAPEKDEPRYIAKAVPSGLSYGGKIWGILDTYTNQFMCMSSDWLKVDDKARELERQHHASVDAETGG